MDRHDSSAGVAMLASYGDEESDSENEIQDSQIRAAVDTISDEDDTPTPTPKAPQSVSRPQSSLAEQENSGSEAEISKKKKKHPNRLVSYGADDLEDDEESEAESSPESEKVEHGSQFVEGKIVNSSLNVEQASLLSRSVLNKSFDEIELPPDPPTKCAKALQDKIAKLYERRVREGLNLNDTIQKRVDFRNPSIYEKLIEFCGIDEKGTNYPPELYNPLIWGKESYYDALDKAQKSDMEKREKERKERTKVEFVTATKKSGSKTEITSSSSSGRPDEKKRKTKWDAEPMQATAGRIAENINRTISANANLTSIATGTKSTVIPSSGNISKKSSK